MHGWRNHGRKSVGLGIVGIILAAILIFSLFKETPRAPESNSTDIQSALEAARKEGYDLGYGNGYDAAKEENASSYQQGYEAARQDIGRQTFTRSGVLGFLLGLLLSTGMVAAIKRKEFSASWHTFKKQYALRKTFQRIPPQSLSGNRGYRPTNCAELHHDSRTITQRAGVHCLAIRQTMAHEITRVDAKSGAFNGINSGTRSCPRQH